MLKRIKVSGYRLLDDFDANLKRLNVVIGANSSGKSTLIDFLTFVSQCMDAPFEAALAQRGGPFYTMPAGRNEPSLKWELTLAKPTCSELWKHIPLEDDTDYVYEVDIGVTKAFELVKKYECLRNAVPYHGHTVPLKFLESKSGRSLIYSFKNKKLVPFDDAAISEDHTAPNEESSPNLERLQERQKRLLLAEMRFPNEYPRPSWIRSLLAWCAYYPALNVTSSSPIRRIFEVRSETTLSQSGDNLGTVLHELFTRSDYRGTASLLREFLTLAYPTVEDIFAEGVPAAPGQIVVRVKERDFRRNFEISELSDGMLRFLCLVVALLNPVTPVWVAIDEPELGLHPRLIPIVADLIKVAAEDRQVIVTTHSPDLLNRFDLDDIAVMTRDEGKARWQRPASRDSLRLMLDSVVGNDLADMHRSGELEAMV
jgi:predicted ATPase